MTWEMACPSCKRLHTFADILPFRAECEACAADLHVCLTCRFHDRYVENECREDQADPVAHKDRRNLCEYWKPRPIGGAQEDEATRARAKLEALFGGARTGASSPGSPAGGEHRPSGPSGPNGATGTSPADEAKRKLEELFRKKP